MVRGRVVDVGAADPDAVGAGGALLEGSKKARGKRAELLEMPDVVEAHVSLWCARPTVGMMVQVKP